MMFRIKELIITSIKGYQSLFCSWFNLWGPPRGFGEQGNKGIYFKGTGEQRLNFEGTKTILGNREHRKQIFDFWGTGEQAILFQGNKRTTTPPPTGRASFMIKRWWITLLNSNTTTTATYSITATADMWIFIYT